MNSWTCLSSHYLSRKKTRVHFSTFCASSCFVVLSCRGPEVSGSETQRAAAASGVSVSGQPERRAGPQHGHQGQRVMFSHKHTSLTSHWLPFVSAAWAELSSSRDEFSSMLQSSNGRICSKCAKNGSRHFWRKYWRVLMQLLHKTSL